MLKRDVLPRLAAALPPGGGRPGITAGRLHSFRHYFCSASADSGASEQMLMSLLGRQNSEMVRHYYLRDEKARPLIERLPFPGPPSPPPSSRTDA